jgi:hypothetical protein
MRQPIAVIGILGILNSYAWAGGDLTVTLDWTAQKPAWKTSKTDSGVITSSLLAAWRQAAGSSGPICAAIWQAAAKLNGAGGCLRNLYNTGNVCQLDQSPAISVNSTSGGVVAHVAFNNNYLKAIYSLQSGPANICGTTQDFDGDPQFNITVSGVANAQFNFSNDKLSVGSVTANITNFHLGGANNSAGFLISLGNLIGAFDGLKADLGQTFDFTSQIGNSLNSSPINADIAKVLQPLQGLGVTSSMVADNDGVHLALDAQDCLPGQTSGTFPCDGTKMCLSAANWNKINSAAASCAKSYFGHGVFSCQGFPNASARGPAPPDGWFGQGSYKCVAPTASQAKATLSSAQNALNACRNEWDDACLNRIPGCQQFVGPSPIGGHLCDPKVVETTGPCSPSALAAAKAAAANNAPLKTCQANQATATNKCQSETTTASASACSSQISALNQAKQLCGEVNCGSP